MSIVFTLISFIWFVADNVIRTHNKVPKPIALFARLLKKILEKFMSLLKKMKKSANVQPIDSNIIQKNSGKQVVL